MQKQKPNGTAPALKIMKELLKCETNEAESRRMEYWSVTTRVNWTCGANTLSFLIFTLSRRARYSLGARAVSEFLPIAFFKAFSVIEICADE